jgi:hypothetical protein
MTFDVWKQSKIQNEFDRMKAIKSEPTAESNRDITLNDLKKLSGITEQVIGEPSNISITGNEKGELMKKNNIQPGTDAWFRLWFAKPYLTGEKPVGK